MDDFCKNIFEDVYRMFNEQAALIMLEIMLDLNQNEHIIKNELK